MQLAVITFFTYNNTQQGDQQKYIVKYCELADAAQLLKCSFCLTPKQPPAEQNPID